MTIAAMTIAPGSIPGLRPGCPTGRREAYPEFTHLFGGRLSRVPQVCAASDSEHGVFLDSSLSSETAAVAAEKVGRLRRDPIGFGTRP
jgi:phosphoenolpyruvate carboxykinase (GTP)